VGQLPWQSRQEHKTGKECINIRPHEPAKPTKGAHKAGLGGSCRWLSVLLWPVSGALVAGFPGRAGRNTKPARSAYKSDRTSPQSRQKEHTKPVWGAPAGGFTCCCCLFQVLSLPASLAELAGTQNRQGVHIHPTARARKADKRSTQSRFGGLLPVALHAAVACFRCSRCRLPWQSRQEHKTGKECI